MSSARSTCQYIQVAGLCGKSCFGEKCGQHNRRKSLSWCLTKCGRGTFSKTGYCRRCGTKQVDINHRMQRHLKRMNTLIDELLIPIYAEMEPINLVG